MESPPCLHYVTRSGESQPSRGAYLADTVDVAPGERYDVVVTAQELGVWALHCHILSHAESARGMFGMVTAVVVRE